METFKVKKKHNIKDGNLSVILEDVKSKIKFGLSPSF